MAPPSDPWDWTVDHVVDALCASRTLWNENRPDSRLPAPARLEQIIRENEINGSTLLTDVTTQLLKDDFGIQPLGQRSALMYAVQRLRMQSLSYTNYTRDVFSQQQHMGAGTSSPTLSTRNLSTPVTTHLPFSTSTQKMRSPTDVQGIESLESPQINGDHQIQDRDWPPGSHARSGEVLTNISGRKRRRLVLDSGPHTSFEPLPVASQAERHKNVAELTPQPAPTSVAEAGSFVATQDNLTRARGTQAGAFHLTASDNTQQHVVYHENSFLGGVKLPVDEIFYGNTRLGQSLEDAPEPQDLVDYNGNNLEFAFLPTHKKSEGYQQYVHSQMRHFFGAPERVEKKLRGRDAVIIYPYREAITHRRSALLFEELNEGIKVTRQESPLMTDGYVSHDNNSSHDWDFLLHWAKENSNVLPAFGDSGSEGEYSGSTLEEFEADEKEAEEAAKQKKGPLSSEAVSAIVDQCIEGFVESWRRKKMPLRENTAWTVWRRGRRQHMRKLLIGIASRDIAKLDRRLTKLKENLLHEVWRNEAEIRRQCTMLEVSVFQREAERWKISVWERRDAPVPSLTRPRKKKRSMSVHASDEEGIDVGSDSEFVSEEEVRFAHIDELDMTDVVAPPVEATESDVRGVSHEDEDAMGIEEQPQQDQISFDNSHDDNDDGLGANLNGRHAAGDTDSLPFMDDIQSGGILPEHETDSGFQPDATVNTEPPHSQAQAAVIDLTYSSDVDVPIDDTVEIADDEATPRAKNPLKHLPSRNTAAPFSSAPEKASDNDILSWSWEELEERSDRKRLILKILRTLNSGEYSSLRSRVLAVREKDFRDEIRRSLGAIIRNATRLAGHSAEDYVLILKFARLYLCWGYCLRQYWRGDVPEPVVSAFLAGLSAQDVDHFYQFIHAAFRKDLRPIPSTTDKFKQLGPSALSQASETQINDDPNLGKSGEDDFEEAMELDTPHKKRKRAVQRSSTALQKRVNALARHQEQSLREQDLSQRMGIDLTEGSENIIINPMEDERSLVRINSQISFKMKQHQIEGVRFMWREVVAAGETQSEMEGCLLAHTMGLGKTMQA